jgi:hypothetical protein
MAHAEGADDRVSRLSAPSLFAGEKTPTQAVPEFFVQKLFLRCYLSRENAPRFITLKPVTTPG